VQTIEEKKGSLPGLRMVRKAHSPTVEVGTYLI
jgi:hypothetical protein